MILHTFNKPTALATAAQFGRAGDRVLLIEDGVYALMGEIGLPGVKVSALDADVSARGLGGKVKTEIDLVNYEGFVQLCCDADSISNWF